MAKTKISIPVEAIMFLPTEREYTEDEVIIKVCYDIETKSEWSIAGYEKEFGWSRTKIEAFFDKLKLKEKLLETQRKVRNTGTPQTLKDREKAFGKSLIPYLETYGKQMIRDFYNHWTAVNLKTGKMAFEEKPQFYIANRLATWKRLSREFNPGAEDIAQSAKLARIEAFEKRRAMTWSYPDDASALASMRSMYSQEQLDEIVDEYGVKNLTGNFNGYLKRREK
ncbi:MAG TPA: hypothetical protein VEP89_04955 [Draconibacterium sp.]|nr:hypothetical protein [Draconibacterium sp.]